MALGRDENNTLPNAMEPEKDGEFLISCGRNLKKNEDEKTGISKSWLLTAKTLFPQDVAIHFEAYEIEKTRKDVKEAAKCFSSLVLDFESDSSVWKEIVEVTNALRATELTREQAFLKDIFYSLPSDIQHRLLRLRATQSDDTMEHCRFMLLLLTNFPDTTVPKHGLELMETLIAAENKTLHQSPINCYRKLLVCNLIPLLVNVDVPENHILLLLIKSFEFYICYLTANVTEIKDLPENESKIENPWKNLFYIYEKFAAKLGWELSNIFSSAWTKDSVWQRITHFIHIHPEVITNDSLCQQLIYAMNLLFLHSLHEYIETIYKGNMILVEIPLDVYNSNSSVTSDDPAPLVKRLKVKIEDDMLVSGQNRRVPISTFVSAFKCWDLFHSAEHFEREFVKATQNLNLENWIDHFLEAVYVYKGCYEECLIRNSSCEDLLKKNIHLVTTYFWLKQYLPMLEGIIEVIQQLNQLNNLSQQTNEWNTVGIHGPTNEFDEELSGFSKQKPGSRHMQFLYLSKENILSYITKLLIVALKRSAETVGDCGANDGHILVLLQLNWPAEEHIFKEITDRIKRNRRFSYPLFTTYIVNMQMLEEFMFLSSDNASTGITLDITIPTNNQLINQRRMSTRGVDKGAKEDFKMSMKRQTTRAGEPAYGLIIRFITTEKDHLVNAFSMLLLN